MRLAINLLTDDPGNPSGAHWFWTRIIPAMADRLTADEELLLLTSPTSRSSHSGYGPKVGYLTFPWSNEHPRLRTMSEHLYSPVRLPLAGLRATRGASALYGDAPVSEDAATVELPSRGPAAHVYQLD